MKKLLILQFIHLKLFPCLSQGPQRETSNIFMQHNASDCNFGIKQFSSVTQVCPSFVTLWTAARQASLSITNSPSLLKTRPLSQ